jgi:hypothetical protein
MQSSPQGIFRAARRFYLLFQLHTTPELARSHGIFGKKSFNQVGLGGGGCQGRGGGESRAGSWEGGAGERGLLKRAQSS